VHAIQVDFCAVAVAPCGLGALDDNMSDAVVAVVRDHGLRGHRLV
jgi:hypothetical protein